MEKNISHELWTFLERQKTKRAKRVLSALNYDILSVYYFEDTKTYYLEKTAGWVSIPQYVREYIKYWARKYMGLSYLYDNPIKGNDNL